MEGQQVNTPQECFAENNKTLFTCKSSATYGHVKVLSDILYDCSVKDRSFADSLIDLLLEVESIKKQAVTDHIMQYEVEKGDTNN